MFISRFKNFTFVPASHEDKKNPGVVKKVLITGKDHHFEGKLKMINWARLNAKKSFLAHLHEDMDEIFIIISGKARITVDKKSKDVAKGDLIVIPRRKTHIMKNLTDKPVDYIALGLSHGVGGKTINVEEKSV